MAESIFLMSQESLTDQMELFSGLFKRYLQLSILTLGLAVHPGRKGLPDVMRCFSDDHSTVPESGEACRAIKEGILT